MSIHTLGRQTSAAAFERIACREGPEKKGFIFLPGEGIKGEPLGIVIGPKRVIILAQDRNLSGNIEHWKLYLKTSIFWGIYNGLFEIGDRPMYREVAKYSTAAQRIMAFTYLPVRVFDPPLPPDDFLTKHDMLRLIRQMLTGFVH